MAERVEIVDLLLSQGLVSQEEIDKAKEESKRTGLALERALEKLGLITETDIANVRATALGVPYMDLTDYIIDAELIKLVPESLAAKYKAVPLFKIGNSLTIAMANPQDIVAQDHIRQVAKIDSIEPVLATEKGIQRILDSFYAAVGSIDEIIKSIGAVSPEASKQIAEEPPVIKLVNILIMQAVKDRASDIHVEPEEGNLRIRYRVDGVLHEVKTLPKKIQSAVISRIKLLGGMDIAENRRPQDGRARLKLENRDLDIRMSSFPTVHGENVVMRLLDRTSVLLGLKQLGFSDKERALFDKHIRRPHGIVLVTGPTGSGKTTTLYAALTTINTIEKNIITIEDPVEYELPLIRQTQVNPKADVTFSNGLRSILRQDPDVIMVGEIRDKGTAEITIQAALTGHLVFSTLHTNDAASALTRLIDMGVEPFLISSSIVSILAQRLVRTLCEKCREKYTPTSAVLKELGIKEKVSFYRAKGCRRCNNTGYTGRIGIFELLEIDEGIRRMVEEKKSADQIKEKARAQGMVALREDGLQKASEGLTTVDEVLRVTEKMEM
ncbi:GspE/PulE family protein [Candidatus Omnitrophota bacterium]